MAITGEVEPLRKVEEDLRLWTFVLLQLRLRTVAAADAIAVSS